MVIKSTHHLFDIHSYNQKARMIVASAAGGYTEHSAVTVSTS